MGSVFGAALFSIIPFTSPTYRFRPSGYKKGVPLGSIARVSGSVDFVWISFPNKMGPADKHDRVSRILRRIVWHRRVAAVEAGPQVAHTNVQKSMKTEVRSDVRSDEN